MRFRPLRLGWISRNDEARSSGPVVKRGESLKHTHDQVGCMFAFFVGSIYVYLWLSHVKSNLLTNKTGMLNRVKYLFCGLNMVFMVQSNLF